MKALSLWQPWATLVAIGAKQYETRGWSTSYRGPLVIHAAKRPDEAEELIEAVRKADVPAGSRFMSCAIKAIYTFWDWPVGSFDFASTLPLGAALCVVDLVDVVRVERVRDGLSDQERAFGNYADGRFAWKLENVRRFKVAGIAMKGHQGLFDCEDWTHWLEAQP